MDSMTKLVVPLLLVFFSSLLFGDINGVESSKQQYSYGSTKLFAFGDSYVDTGNIKKQEAVVPWAFPYGNTYPGTPSGRFSDGRVSTDYLATKVLKIKTPIPYQWKDHAGHERLQYGMNFAVGGTGVFKTTSSNLNMTYQINLFEQLIGDVYSPSDLSSSLALVSVAGNDYLTYVSEHGVDLGIFIFMKRVIHQTEVNLRRIHALGVKKVAIPLLQPLGCLPLFAKDSSYQKCSDIINAFVIIHNNELKKVVANLNKETKQSTFMVIDYYNAFLTVFKNKGEKPGSQRFETPYKACCGGLCGSVDKNGQKNYTLCDDPTSSFFWDGLHPTQEGWKSVYSVLNLTALSI
ncbi:PREDICTED: GDSL esterase/lipase At5g03610-like isoform X1 [Camelina sativa]|uniref:GDSL esterase/lipase At5g03610-like isoform X1 n=1 Tax=Camelina sativa TaxID=90675 RepID=A0ABM0XTJ8_CAMSA|nr:PREDICTED: GDSL esterase/lipase At5g03610-like isoform X2 [Camelina sativa]XP_019098016.1 PREDICTED: GDSL esterase/lipase At5g03610-like isoform X1 [Camelina sativa]